MDAYLAARNNLVDVVTYLMPPPNNDEIKKRNAKIVKHIFGNGPDGVPANEEDQRLEIRNMIDRMAEINQTDIEELDGMKAAE